MGRFNCTNSWLQLPKLESSRNVTSKVITNRIKARKSKCTEQYDYKPFFRLVGTCNSMVELSNSKGWDFDSTIKFNTSTGEDYCEWFVCGVCGTEVAFDIKQLSWLHSFLSFFPETSKLQSAVYSEWKHFCLTLHCYWTDRYLGISIHESAKLLTY